MLSNSAHFAATVRHYNRGWANGHEWGIRYWEIWNEPDGLDDMWCLPEGDETSWNQTAAGKVLGIQRTYVSRLLNELHIRDVR